MPARDLILALTADEEGGGANGVGWMLANHKELIDAEYAINEGGGGTLMDDKPLFHSIQAAEKVPVNFTLTVLNTGGHSSVPRKDNAIYQLANALAKIERVHVPGGAERRLASVLRADGQGGDAVAGGRHARDRGEPDGYRRRRHHLQGSALRVDAAHQLRGHPPCRRPCRQRAAADGHRQRQLPHRARRPPAPT